MKKKSKCNHMIWKLPGYQSEQRDFPALSGSGMKWAVCLSLYPTRWRIDCRGVWSAAVHQRWKLQNKCQAFFHTEGLHNRGYKATRLPSRSANGRFEDLEMRDWTCGAGISERAALEKKQLESVWDKERDQTALGNMNVANEIVRCAQVVCSFSRQGNVFPEHAEHVQEKESLTQRGDCAKVIPLNSGLDFDSSIKVDNLQKGYVDYSVDATTRRFKTRTLAKMQRNLQHFKAFHHLEPPYNPNQMELSDNPNQLEPPDNRNQLKPPYKPNQMGPADKQPRSASKISMTDDSNLSVYSLYMERDFRYYFQYPYLRLLVAVFVTICNFFMYAEDPVAHSCKEARVSIIGNGFAFMFRQYAPNAWSVVKVLTWLSGIITGMLVGKFLLHQLFFSQYIFSISFWVFDHPQVQHFLCCKTVLSFPFAMPMWTGSYLS